MGYKVYTGYGYCSCLIRPRLNNGLHKNYAKICQPFRRDEYLILLSPIQAAKFHKYCLLYRPSTASVITPYFLRGVYLVLRVVFLLVLAFLSFVGVMFIQ
jgi:hypothetical protein